MKRLLLTTALLGAPFAAPMSAAAQDQFRVEADPTELRASDFIGMRVYATEAAVDADEYAGLQEGWEDIGEVNDVILGRDGTAQAVLVDIGGFLGMGERQVAVAMSSLRFVSDSATAEDAGDYFLVLNASRAVLEGAPEYAGAMAPAAMGTDAMAADGAMATEDATATDAATDATAEADPAVAAQETAAEVEAASADTSGSGAGTDPAADTAEMAVEGEAMTETETEAQETAEVATDAATDAAATDATASTDVAATEPAAAEGAMAADATASTEATAADAAATDGMAAETAATDEAMATDDVAADVAAEGAVARTPIEREGFLVAPAEVLTADRLQGAGVYDANDERVGEVGELLLTAEGQVESVVVDVGGFLGIGEKPVSMAMGDVDILQQDGGEEIRVYVSETREQLEALPTYEN